MVTDEKLEVIRGLPSFRQALLLWASQRNAVGFNEWQQAVSQIRPLFPEDEEAPPKGDRDYNHKVASLWREIMRDVHGPDWRNTLGKPEPKAKAAPQRGPEPEGADEDDPGGPESRAVRPALGNPGE